MRLCGEGWKYAKIIFHKKKTLWLAENRSVAWSKVKKENHDYVRAKGPRTEIKLPKTGTTHAYDPSVVSHMFVRLGVGQL